MSKVLTVGTFDLYHSGHTDFIFQCAKIAGIFNTIERQLSEKYSVTIGLNSDEFVENYKGKKPLYSYEERQKLLVNNRYVWSVEKNDTPTIKPLLLGKHSYSEYDFLVIGSDWAIKDYYAQIGVTQEWLDNQNITLCYVPYTKNISTSILKERIIGT